MTNLTGELSAYLDELVSRAGNSDLVRNPPSPLRRLPSRRRSFVGAFVLVLTVPLLVVTAIAVTRGQDVEQVTNDRSRTGSLEPQTHVVAESLPRDLADPSARRTIFEISGDPIQAYNAQLEKARQQGYNIKAAAAEAQCDPPLGKTGTSGSRPEKVVCQAIGTSANGPISITLQHSDRDYLDVSTKRADLQAFGGDPFLPDDVALPAIQKSEPPADQRLADWFAVAENDKLVVATSALALGVCGNELTAILRTSGTALEATERYLDKLRVWGLYGQPSASASPDGRDAMASANMPGDGTYFELAARDHTLIITICE